MNNWKLLPSFLVSIQCLESVYGIDRGDSSQVEKLKFDKPLEEIFESAIKVCILLEDFCCNIWHVHVHVGFIEKTDLANIKHDNEFADFQCYFHVIFQSVGGSTSAQSTEENRLKAENLKTEGRLIL